MPPSPFFRGAGFDRADLLRADPAALRGLAARAGARQLEWRDGLPAVGDDGRLQWKATDRPDLFLGLDGEVPHFAALPDTLGDVRSAFATLGLLSAADAPVYAAALSLASWHARHRFCADCGQTTEVVRGGWSRRCASCSAEHFPRVDPVVIMLAVHDGRLLLGRQPHYPPGRYSALAGFVEVGEAIEDAVAREFHEEAGIVVRNVRYVASQPWPFPSSLMIGCIAEAEAEDLTIDTTELDDARWFTRAEVASALAGEEGAPFLPPPPWAIARTLLDWWLGPLEEGADRP